MNVLQSSFFWEVGGWIALLIVGVLWISSDFRQQVSRNQQLGLLLLLIGLLLIKRLPILFINWELNPDESQLLSQAITLRHHPVYWKYVDGATMGPLSSYYVAIPGYFGVPLNYVVLRWTAFLCLLVSIVSGYFALENFFNARVARLALLPGITFLAFTTHADFLHATNEQLSLALIGLAIWQYSRIWRQQSLYSASNLFILGFVSSLVPFAKLQGTPTVLVLIMAAFISLLRQYSQRTAASSWQAIVGLVAGGLFFPLLVVVLAMGFGVFADFVHFYIAGNLAYSAGAGFWYFLGQFPQFVGRTGDFLVFLIPTFVGLAIWLFQPSRVDEQRKSLLLLILALIAASGYAVIKPGNEFTHYLLYLLVPVCLLNAWFIDRLRAPFHTVFWVATVVFLAGINALLQKNSLVKDPSYAYRNAPFAFRYFHLSPTAQEIRKLAGSGEDLVVWGWAPQYNVQTQMPQGVCDNHTIRCVMGQDQQVHRTRYLKNIQASQPPVFVDAVGPHSMWLYDRATYGYETFPELKAYIDRHYRLVGEFEKNRVFARIDRYKPLTSSANTYVDEKRTHL